MRLRPAPLLTGSIFAGALWLGGRTASGGSPLPHRVMGAVPSRGAERAAPVVEEAPSVVALPAGPILVRSVNTLEEASLRLYTASGAIDGAAVAEFSRVANGGGDVPALAVRTVQLAIRAAYRFGGARTIEVVSAVRPEKRGGPHAAGVALDFRLVGVKAARLAAYLRHSPRAGVGVYTHPRTQYVHLDVRPESFHWIDGSPPRVSWREQRIPDWGRGARDAAYDESSDLPDRAEGPLDPRTL